MGACWDQLFAPLERGGVVDAATSFDSLLEGVLCTDDSDIGLTWELRPWIRAADQVGALALDWHCRKCRCRVCGQQR